MKRSAGELKQRVEVGATAYVDGAAAYVGRWKPSGRLAVEGGAEERAP